MLILVKIISYNGKKIRKKNYIVNLYLLKIAIITNSKF